MPVDTRSDSRHEACRNAINTRDVSARSATEAATSRDVTSSYFAKLTLGWKTLSGRLDAEDAAAFVDFVQHGRLMPKQTANHVAEQVKRWAMENGAMFYAHWFHPLTGVPADKHDSFLARGVEPGLGLAPIEQLPGSRLIQGEPDASSFPSGGLRSTHQARGYTVWDPTSPMFIRSEGATRTVCIPCAYVSWSGHSLDLKTPLLRSREALSRELPPLLELVSGAASKGVFSTLGTEQEYFLVDRGFLASRPDLVMAGRTLCGAPPARGQQLEDHYFGPIPARVQSYIAEVEHELTRLGIPVKTRHCEVAPAQFELAPIFEEVNVACDHNVLTMDVMRRVAERHGLACLLHEKPFAGVNGSGKHNNWSVSTTDNENLLEPGHDPANNLRFLLMLAVVLQAVHQHADLMRVTIASAANDHRLGANEAPPAIISVYLGDAMDRLVTNVEHGKFVLDVEVPNIQASTTIRANADLTDRNRTTPFAFTGNKFEFRAVGSTENPAWPMTVLNTAVADSAKQLRARLEGKLSHGGERIAAVRELVSEVFRETRSIRYEGNNYAKEWVIEAERRGLPVLRNTPAALARLLQKEPTQFLVEQRVFTPDEIASRYDVYAEKYIKTIEIEAVTLGEMASTQVLPLVDGEIGGLAGARSVLESLHLSSPRLQDRVRRLSQLGDELHDAVGRMMKARERVHGQDTLAASMGVVASELLPMMQAVRQAIDALEGVVDDAHWPFAKYREMLFLGV